MCIMKVLLKHCQSCDLRKVREAVVHKKPGSNLKFDPSGLMSTFHSKYGAKTHCHTKLSIALSGLRSDIFNLPHLR